MGVVRYEYPIKKVQGNGLVLRVIVGVERYCEYGDQSIHATRPAPEKIKTRQIPKGAQQYERGISIWEKGDTRNAVSVSAGFEVTDPGSPGNT